jgi:ribonuclease P/MRP protein subunit POP5
MRRIERKRYLFLTIMRERIFYQMDLRNALWNAILGLYGENGASRINLRIIRFDSDARFAILRCPHKELNQARAAIASITKINNEDVSLSVTRVSGTIKSLMKKSILR